MSDSTSGTSGTSSCPRCGQPAAGKFCAACGAALVARTCPGCGAAAEPGSRFCTQCGEPIAGPPREPVAKRAAAARTSGARGGPPSGRSAPAATTSSEPHLGWWAAGGLLVVLILVVVWPVVRPGPSTPDPAGGAGGAGGGGPAAGAAGVDLSSMTPREAADRLYGRVMGAAEVGDSATARGFVPMAVSAYEQARPLDVDGLFHLSSLQRVAGEFAAALSTAGEALANEPDHLLNLYAAAEASRELGDAEEARRYYQRLVDVWDEQMASGHLDYQAHATMMSSVRSAAVEFLAEGGA